MQTCAGNWCSTKATCKKNRTLGTPPPPAPCGDAWVCHVVIALREIARATALHRQKEVKADHEPERPVLGAFRQRLQGRWAVYTLYLCVDDP